MFDTETNAPFALSDCAWWDEPVLKRPWWAQRDCAGRVGETALAVVLCEEHLNAFPTTKKWIVADDNSVRGMSTCPIDQKEYDKARDAYVTVHERKGPSTDLCSAACAITWWED